VADTRTQARFYELYEVCQFVRLGRAEQLGGVVMRSAALSANESIANKEVRGFHH